MTQIEALDALIAAIEAGTWDRRYDEPYEASGLRGWTLTIDEIMDYGSLDAAKRLHDALLPGWHVDRISQDREGYWCVILMTKAEPWQASTAIQADFARAWLLATLKAYRETLE